LPQTHLTSEGEISKRRYIAALVFACILIASLLTLLWIEHKRRLESEAWLLRSVKEVRLLERELELAGRPPRLEDAAKMVEPSPRYEPVLIWIPAFAAILSAIGTISTIILAWRSDRRSARESALKIAQLERELAEAKGSTKPKKSGKKAH